MRTIALMICVSLLIVIGAGCDGSTTQGEEVGACDSNYAGACLDPNVSDYDCVGGSGDGPLYTGEVTVVGEDHYGLDSDGGGIGCEGE